MGTDARTTLRPPWRPIEPSASVRLAVTGRSGHAGPMWWVAIAGAAECEGLDPKLPCACEQQRAQQVGAALASAGSGTARRLSEAAWKRSAQSTCAWVERFAPAGGCATTTCVRQVTEDRLATVSSTAPGARAADLQRVTGRTCAEGDKSCATAARTAEEERLVAVVEALAHLGLPAVDAQRDWHVYRDGACDAEAVAGAPDGGAWTRAACGAVLAARRTDVLATLASLRDPETASLIDDVRWKTAYGGLRPRTHPWADWLRAEGDDPSARALIREAVEARVDGALFPPLVSTESWSRCTDPSALACIREVHRETRAQLDLLRTSGAAPESPEETAWRRGWCGDRPDDATREACEAEIDWIVAAVRAP